MNEFFSFILCNNSSVHFSVFPPSAIFFLSFSLFLSLRPLFSSSFLFPYSIFTHVLSSPPLQFPSWHSSPNSHGLFLFHGETLSALLFTPFLLFSVFLFPSSLSWCVVVHVLNVLYTISRHVRVWFMSVLQQLFFQPCLRIICVCTALLCASVFISTCVYSQVAQSIALEGVFISSQ